MEDWSPYIWRNGVPIYGGLESLYMEEWSPYILGLGEKVKVSKTFRPTCFLMYFSISSIVSFLNFFDLSAPSVVKLRFFEN